MTTTRPTCRIAAVQAAPLFMDRQATLAKAAALVTAAAERGADLVVFPESFVPGYPDWVWMLPPGQGPALAQLYAEFVDASPTARTADLEPVCRSAAQSHVHVALGISERSSAGTSLFNCLVLIGPDGDIRGLHRKLVPTGGERLVWAQGDGSTLEAWDSPFGRIGGLICWENYMPLARYALWAWGVQIYLAPTWDHGDAWLATLRHIAREGRAVVVGCGTVLHRNDIPDRFAFKALYPPDRSWINPGDSAIVGPNGAFLAGPVREKEEILLAEVNRAELRGRKWDLDVAGHYMRPDVFHLTLDRAPHALLDVRDSPPPDLDS
jgi:nitrilase